MSHTVLSVNPGSGSTKVGLFTDNEKVLTEAISHSLEEIRKFESVNDQLDFRTGAILKILDEHDVDLKEVDAVVGRGGALPPLDAGAYAVNDAMIDFFFNKTTNEHVSNLGAQIARSLAAQAKKGALALVYDCISIDEFEDAARVSGLRGIERKSLGHFLNSRASARKACEKNRLDYKNSNLIVVHMGSGNTTSLHVNGRVVDLVADDEGPMATERTGALPVKQVIEWCYEKSKREMLALYKREGGLISYLGTNDARVVEERIANGDKEAELVYSAMAYQFGKGIGELAAAARGKIDLIVLTGGVAHSAYITERIREMVKFIAPVVLQPGEYELEALAAGGYRVLKGEEAVHTFVIKE
jgi:butyrate kinase